MKKTEIIKRHGEAAYKRRLENNRQWNNANPKKIEEHNHELNRKGGRFYLNKLKYQRAGLQGERNKVRHMHGHMWSRYKRIIAPGSQLHHSWYPQSAEYEGLALVEANQHRHGIIDVIEILEGEITVFTEKEIANRGEL